MSKKIKKRLLESEFNENCLLLKLLSDHMILFVFQHLDSFSLSNAARVCRRWYHLTQDKTLTKHFDSRMKPLGLKQLWNVLRKKLTISTSSVHLCGAKSPNKIEMLSLAFLKDLQKQCPYITALSLELFDFHSINIEALPINLHSLSLKGSILSLGWFDPLKSGRCFTKLKYLNLTDCTKLCNNDLEAISYISSLEKLYLQNCYRISARGIPSITISMKFLTTIDLSKVPAVNNVVMHYLSQLQQLLELCLRFCHLITDDGIRKLFHGSVGETLRMLDIFKCHELTNNTLDVIIKQSKSLRLLDIGGNNKYTDSKVREVCGLLCFCDVKWQANDTVSECFLNNYDYNQCLDVKRQSNL
ncbi:F-box/LRR-repeat protein 12 [Hydra vulgaris]|uniref:F-box/LRR-repeat protein 12 n=1 Tax=Hydra vulgaris TaxID=6087 RepID=A0ABM4C1U6_HYDVU